MPRRATTPGDRRSRAGSRTRLLGDIQRCPSLPAGPRSLGATAQESRSESRRHGAGHMLRRRRQEVPLEVLVLRFSAAPKGPKQESPGQRPGDLIRMKIPPALKGRNKILDHKPVLPLQGVVILNTRSDSQGGALGWHVAAPSGRDSRSATSKTRSWGPPLGSRGSCPIGRVRGRAGQGRVPAARVPLPTHPGAVQAVADRRDVGAGRVVGVAVVLRGEQAIAIGVGVYRGQVRRVDRVDGAVLVEGLPRGVWNGAPMGVILPSWMILPFLSRASCPLASSIGWRLDGAL